MGGIAHTRGGVGERVERIRRDVKGVVIPGVRRLALDLSRPSSKTVLERDLK